MKYFDTRVLERRTVRIIMSEDADTIPSRKELLSHLLSKVGELSRDEPIIAANINEQLQHMGLSTWSLSAIRRIRDTVYRVNPDSILEVGAAIGHRTAWLLDLFEQHNQPSRDSDRPHSRPPPRSDIACASKTTFFGFRAKQTLTDTRLPTVPQASNLAIFASAAAEPRSAAHARRRCRKASPSPC